MKAFRDGQQDAEYLTLLAESSVPPAASCSSCELQPVLQGEVAVDGAMDVRAADAGNISYKGLTPGHALPPAPHDRPQR